MPKTTATPATAETRFLAAVGIKLRENDRDLTRENIAEAMREVIADQAAIADKMINDDDLFLVLAFRIYCEIRAENKSSFSADKC